MSDEEVELTPISRGTFRNRFLTDEQNVFAFNAWDNVQWDDEQQQRAQEAVVQNSLTKVPAEKADEIRGHADQNWDKFYDVHQSRFFKDRHWLFVEFPELNIGPGDQSINIFELGCGVGNTLLPVMSYNDAPQLRAYGCDFSARAIEMFRANSEFDSKRCELFLMDATLEEWKVPFAENSLDIILMVFMLSAVEPAKMQRIAENCSRYLRPGGTVLFRDYGRYDLAQLRFKDGKCMEDNLYVRGDGTMVYFFQQEDVRKLFTSVGLVEAQNIIDRRLQIHRGRQLKMYRVWIQAKYKKPLPEPLPEPSTTEPTK